MRERENFLDCICAVLHVHLMGDENLMAGKLSSVPSCLYRLVLETVKCSFLSIQAGTVYALQLIIANVLRSSLYVSLCMYVCIVFTCA